MGHQIQYSLHHLHKIENVFNNTDNLSMSRQNAALNVGLLRSNSHRHPGLQLFDATLIARMIG
jgi:hypothetical protein